MKKHNYVIKISTTEYDAVIAEENYVGKTIREIFKIAYRGFRSFDMISPIVDVYKDGFLIMRFYHKLCVNMRITRCIYASPKSKAFRISTIRDFA